jgi:predicted O-methyltransferase YrrM
MPYVSLIADVCFILIIVCFILALIKWAILSIKNYIFNKKLKSIQTKVDSLYQNNDIYSLAQKSKQTNSTDYDLTYGEIGTLNILYLLNYAKAKRNNRFVDLGSGAGKATIAVALAYKVNAKGIEISPELHKLAKTTLNNAKILTSCNIEFSNNDYFNEDLSQYDIFFINATALNEKLWGEITSKFLTLKKVRIITISKQLPEDHFKCLYQGLEYASWGWVSAFVYEKI